MSRELEQPDEKQLLLPKSNLFERKSIFLLICLCLTAFVVNTVSSLASPFYPSDAAKNGVSEAVIGVILGMYHITVFFVAPLTPFLINKISPQKTLKIGIFVAGVSAICFGFINKCRNTVVFILISVLLRLTQGCGCAFVDTSLYTIVSERYPSDLGKVSGFLTTSVGLGFMIGPPAGGFLYSVGGFLLPFLVMGVLALVIGIAMILCLTNENQNDNNNRQRLFSLYAYVDTDGMEHSIVGFTDSGDRTHWATAAKDIPFVPNVQLSDKVSLVRILSDTKLVIILLTTVIGSSILGFQEPNLGLFLESCGYGPASVGGLFLIRDFLFAIGSILVGYVVDATGPYSVLAVGLGLGGVGYLALGPIIPFAANTVSIIIGLCITGFAGSIPWVSGLPCLLKATRYLGNKESLNSQLSGLQNSCLYLGIFIGSVLGGAFLDRLSYQHTYLYFSIVPVTTALLFTLAMFIKRSRGNANLEESIRN